MNIEILPKANSKLIYTIFLEEEPWGDFHTKIFGKTFKIPSCSSPAEFENYFFSLEYTKAKKYVLDLLSQRNYPSMQLEQLLSKCFVSKNNIDKILNEFIQQGYINDQEWMERFVEGQVRKGISPKGILYKLMNKGLKSFEAQNQIDKIVVKEDLNESLKKLIKTKYRKYDLNDFKQKQKVFASLLRKGFEMEAIKSALSLDLDIQ